MRHGYRLGEGQGLGAQAGGRGARGRGSVLPLVPAVTLQAGLVLQLEVSLGGRRGAGDSILAGGLRLHRGVVVSRLVVVAVVVAVIIGHTVTSFQTKGSEGLPHWSVEWHQRNLSISLSSAVQGFPD